MRRDHHCAVIAIIAVLAASGMAGAQITLEWPGGTLVLNADASCASLIENTSGRECVRQDPHGIAVVTVNGKAHEASSLQATDEGFAVRFSNVDTVLSYAVAAEDDWLLLTLRSVSGTRPEQVTLFRLPVAITEHIGTILNIGWDEQTAVCVMAGNLQTRCRATKGERPFLNAFTQDAPGPKLEGAAVAVIACPTERFRAVAAAVARACGLPTNEAPDGTPAKQTEMVRGSYWFLTVTPDNLDRVIEYCRLSGIRQVMISSASWCRNVGHYTFRDRYPNGIEDLKAVVDRLHANGILAGMHCFVSKVSKTDAYVTPVPDRRFWVDMEDTLAGDIGPGDTEIRVAGDLREWPGSPVASRTYWEGGIAKHRECLIGDEIIRYEAIGPQGVWDTFLGCERGAWGTTATAHSAGDRVRHYGVDGCINGYIIDQETDLMAEVADRIAYIFNYCGFDMVYFDGGEDVDRRRYNYYSTNFQYQAMRRFTKRPIIHMGTVLTHRLWHSFARSGTVDTYLNTLHGAIVGGRSIDEWPTVREHIDRSVRRALRLRDDMMPAELGWFGIWPAQENTDGLQLDEVEYLMCKSLAYDLPVSLETSFSQMDKHPLTPEILHIFRVYEELRMTRALPEEVTAPLGEIGRDFAMLRDGERVSFVAVRPALVGGGREVQAMVGENPNGAVALLWHYTGRNGLLRLDVDPHLLRVTDFDGAPIEFEVLGGTPRIPVGAFRTTLYVTGWSAQELAAALESAKVTLRRPTMIFISAADYDRLVGEMALGSDVGIEDPDAFGDVVLCTGTPNREQPRDWYAQYTVKIPHEGVWTLWARVRYPRGGDLSFGLVRPGEQVTLDYNQILGNCGANEGKWHWTGRGGGSTTVPPGRPVTLQLPQGPFTFRIYPREGSGLSTNPRLDLICLVDDPLYVPDDDDARRLLR